jgi:fructokinase
LRGESNYIVVGLGEVLWDILPIGEQQLGGAPANFTFLTALLGDRGIIASRTGDDPLGYEALDRLEQADVNITHVQHDTSHPTGTARVQLDDEGKPAYTIVEDVAWDYFELTADWQELAAHADAVCFGSLAQRSPESRDTIRSFLKATRDETLIVFDVNLRKPFYSVEVLSESLRLSNIVKLNDEELRTVFELLNLDCRDEDSARRLLHYYDLQMVCVTRGDRGSLLVTESASVEHPGFKVDVADTIGAGDAFSAALVHHYLRGASLERISDAANRLAALVATQVGATPAAVTTEDR